MFAIIPYRLIMICFFRCYFYKIDLHKENISEFIEKILRDN